MSVKDRNAAILTAIIKKNFDKDPSSMQTVRKSMQSWKIQSVHATVNHTKGFVSADNGNLIKTIQVNWSAIREVSGCNVNRKRKFCVVVEIYVSRESCRHYALISCQTLRALEKRLILAHNCNIYSILQQSQYFSIPTIIFYKKKIYIISCFICSRSIFHCFMQRVQKYCLWPKRSYRGTKLINILIYRLKHLCYVFS